MNLRKIEAVALWSLAALLCLAIYWPAFATWFQDDDFAFLGVLPTIRGGGHLIVTLLQPSPAGGWRPLSDRIYFCALEALFGPNPLPFHMVSFLTQFANLALIGALTRRLTGSVLAGILAPVIWIADTKLLLVMTWCVAYDYLLCGLLLLTSFWLFLRWVDTGKRGYSVGMWTAFLLGFGALETITVFPLLAATYALLCARNYFRRTLPLFIPSVVFVTLHVTFIQVAATGPYRMHFTGGMITTFGRYWAWAFEPDNLSAFAHLPQNLAIFGMVLFSAALLGFAAARAARRDLVPVFFLCWFAIVLLPVLPLRDNMADLYLALPSIGLAMLAAYAFKSMWQNRLPHKAAVAALLGLYLLESVPTAHGAAEWYQHRSVAVKQLVGAVTAEQAQYPGRTILLKGIDSPLFEASVRHHPFRVFGITNVYLAPGSEPVVGTSDQATLTEFVLPAPQMTDATAPAVLERREDRWVDITSSYSAPLPVAEDVKRQRVDVGDPRDQRRLGPEWYPLDQGFRWMPKRATVQLAGPVLKGQKLVVSGYCPAAQVASGPLGMVVSVDGIAFPAVHIAKGNAPFSFEFPLSESRGGNVLVGVEVDRTFSTAQDRRRLGLTFGTFEIR